MMDAEITTKTLTQRCEHCGRLHTYSASLPIRSGGREYLFYCERERKELPSVRVKVRKET